jgi:hypothetical protein
LIHVPVWIDPRRTLDKISGVSSRAQPLSADICRNLPQPSAEVGLFAQFSQALERRDERVLSRIQRLLSTPEHVSAKPIYEVLIPSHEFNERVLASRQTRSHEIGVRLRLCRKGHSITQMLRGYEIRQLF